MRLLALRIKTTERAKRAVILKSHVDFLCYRVSDFEVRSELETFVLTRTRQCALERGIECEIPLAQVLVDDRTNLPAPRILRKLSSHEADLLRKTNADRPVPFRRNPKAWPDVRADIIPSAAVAGAGEDVE